MGLVLFLSAFGSHWFLSVSQPNETPSHGVGYLCSKICICRGIHFDLSCLLVPRVTFVMASH